VLKKNPFLDVRATKADDYYITITESKKFTEEDGSFHFKKHKIYLYKEDFLLAEILRYDFLCFKPQRRRSNSERHQKDFKKNMLLKSSGRRSRTKYIKFYRY
jgi:hypothetical protein